MDMIVRKFANIVDVSPEIKILIEYTSRLLAVSMGESCWQGEWLEMWEGILSFDIDGLWGEIQFYRGWVEVCS